MFVDSFIVLVDALFLLHQFQAFVPLLRVFGVFRFFNYQVFICGSHTCKDLLGSHIIQYDLVDLRGTSCLLIYLRSISVIQNIEGHVDAFNLIPFPSQYTTPPIFITRE